MKFKRFATMLLAMIMIFSCLAMSASAAGAQPYNNYEDTAFSFNFSNLGRSNTEGRAKEDKSGTYIYANNMCSGGFDVFVDGLRTSDGKWVDCTDKTTRGQPHLSTPGKGYLIAQYVKENKYNTARLGGYKPWAFCTVTGLWSPDSVDEDKYSYLSSKT